MRVITKDFQRLKGENTFEFPIGITVVQGRSGSGKTTLFYAVHDCLANPSGVSDVINWDAKQAEVTVENNDTQVTWIKTPSSCTYVDESGKEYVKASKIDSRDLGNLGFYFNKKDEVMNICDEWSVLFPFNLSDTEMFKMFEDMFNISSSSQIIDNIKTDEKEYKAKLATLSNQVNDLTIKNNNIEEILSKVNLDVDKFISDVNTKENTLSGTQQDFNVIQTQQKYLDILIPEEFEVRHLSQVFSKYQHVLKDLADYLKFKNQAELALPEVKSFDIIENSYKADYDDYMKNLDEITHCDLCLVNLEKEELQIREKLKAIKVCPTCGQPLNY